MTQQKLKELEAKLNLDYESASFEIVEVNEFPELEEIPRGKAVRLTNVGYGFFDLRGFTAWSEQKRDKTVFKVLEPTLGTLTRVIRLHGGNIEKPTGDGLMFVVGANEPDPEKVVVRTLQCAIDLGQVMADVVNPYMKRKGHISEELSWGIGLEMGNALVAKVGIRNHDFLTSISKAANFASKLENAAGLNQILVGEGLYEKAPPEIKECLVFQGLLPHTSREYYELKPKTDANGKPTLLKAMSGEQVRRYGLGEWLLGGVIAAAALQGVKALAQAKPHRWYGDEGE
ncbi:adenylate/guanylate cyclase domain-containing protein [Allomeiothermus silvanus]|uniref:adenylate/guanylate cyclase domain-containing protein n=1 Tax=Allomeiothermus silvanus TaxID=52022 RepID=UPI0023F09A7C|nr:adenylate/guanylate cyclase domain-containing protein [Allomeiothermus silvanus]